jgi:ribosomal protein S12 methylthiotransferase accessory factor
MTTDLRPRPGAAPPGAVADTASAAPPAPLAALSAAITAALSAHHGAPSAVPLATPVSALPLGLRDELSVGPDEPPGGGASASGAGVYVYGHHALVGPFGGAGGGAACGRCLVRRWQAVRTRGLRDALETGTATRAAGTAPWAVPFVADALAAVLAARRTPPGGGRFPYAYLVDLETLAVTPFRYVPDAECPVCGDRPADSEVDARLDVPSSPKRAPDAFRVRPADAYDVPLDPFVNPAAGMLGPSVVPDLASASTSSAIGSFLLRSGDYLRECFWGGHTARYRSSVRVGLLEGLERFAGMRPRGRRTDLTAAYDELAAEYGDQVLDPRICGLYSEEFHRAEPGVRPFDPARPVPWVRGWSLRDRRPVLVPEILAYYHAPGGLTNRFVQESSNGCASGGSPAEAVYFGLMEVIERDAFLLAWYGRAPLTEIDPSGSRRPETRAMIDRLAMYGYRARFFDTRVSFAVPVVTAVAERVDGGMGRLCFGAGAGLDPEAALAAGLCEIATDAVNLRRRTLREERRLRAMAADFGKVQVLHDHPLLYGLPEMARYADFLLRREATPVTPLHALARDTVPPARDMRDDVAHVVAEVARAGFDVIAVDQTMPEQRELGFHTAGVIVPGLLPIDFGWARQRARHMRRTRTALRDAGLVPRELAADDLNPAPHPFP